MTNTVSEILQDYNKKLEESDICYKNIDRQHDYESINSQYISTNIIEVEYFCLECGNLKYVYNYLQEDEN
jgi:hypothetical protein